MFKHLPRVFFVSTFTCLVLVFCLANIGLAGGHGHKKEDKKGILLVSFGSTVPAAQAVLKTALEKIKTTHPGVDVRSAYSSKIIRNKLAKEGQNVDSPIQALARMADDDFTHVAVQSLHSIPGHEYHALLETAHAFAGIPKGIEQVTVGLPLLSTSEDVERVAKALLANLPKDRTPQDAVILLGHGSDHPANIYYPGIQYYLWKLDPNVFIGTVEGSPTLDDILPALKKNKSKKIFLLPFMAVAGDHAINDMAGDEDDSWKSILTKQGYTCVPVLKGTAQYDDVLAIWLDHLNHAWKALK